jgi:Cys-tRNA(Pro)/Cys-tRNA(Cys) deacylase
MFMAKKMRKAYKEHKPAKKAEKVLKAEKPVKVPASPVTNFLKHHKVEFEVLPQKKHVWAAEDIAKVRNRPLASVVKCLLLTDGKTHVVACVPGDRKIKARKVQKLLKTGKLEFAPEKHLTKLTGHMLGTLAPVALKKKLPVVLDKAILARAKVNISAGKPGFGVELHSKVLAKLAGAKVADIKQ